MCKDGTRGERVKRSMTAAVKSGQRRPDEDMLREEKVHAQYITLSPVDSRFISICVTNFSSDRDYSHDWDGHDDYILSLMGLPCS